MNTIEIRDVSKSYGAIKALSGITLSVREAELFGLIGPDGAGKTTLFRILTTLLNPDSGTASVAGFDVQQSYRRIRNVVGYMPGRFSLYPDLSVAENLDFFAALFGVDVQDNYELIAPIYYQIAPFSKRKAGKLSGGMKQKLALCCALIHKPTVLFLDEPTTGVDAVSRNEFWQMLAELKGKGITIFVSTPYMDEAQACDRVALIDKGRILAIDEPAKLAAGAGENLYKASADEMWPLLLTLRGLPQVAECYTFGETHHVVTKEALEIPATIDILEHSGLHNVSISPAEGNIEDLFIKLMHNG